MSRDRREELLDLPNAFNDIALRLSAGANEVTVIRAVDRLLDPYGGQGAYGRSTQPSHVILEAHIRPVAALAVVVPAIFLAVAVFLINVVLSRLVATDRTQIGMLKAFGYGNGSWPDTTCSSPGPSSVEDSCSACPSAYGLGE